MSEQAAPRVHRLNPFVFPSDTTLRFILLVIFVLCGSMRLYGEFRETDPRSRECTSQAWSKVSKLDMSNPANADRNAETIKKDVLPFLARCGEMMRSQVVWETSGMCLILLIAAFFYYLYPIWRLKTARLEPIGLSGPPELQRELHGIAETARLPDPVFVWNPLATGLPVVFGRHSKYYVALSGSFVSQYFYKDRASFRAIMLHELAHIANGDVHKTYLTISLCLAFFAAALAPALVISFLHLATLHWWKAVSLLLDSALWMGVIVLSGLAVLRAREYYADVRASAWDRESQIDRVLGGYSSHDGKKWRGYFRFHPDWAKRGQVVKDPSRLFRLGFTDAFGIGIAAWFVVEVVIGILIPFLPRDASMALTFFGSINLIVPAVVFVFAIGAIGIGVWRTAFASLLKSEPPSRGTGWLAVAFVAGTLPGLAVLAAETASQSFVEVPMPFSSLSQTFLFKGLTYAGLLLACLLIFRWLSEAASAWFEVVLHRRSPWPILLLTVATALILLAGMYVLVSFFVMFSVVVTPWRQGGPNWIYAYGLFAGGPVLIASMLVWAFPLAARWWRKQSAPGEVAPWVFLDGPPPNIPSRQPVHLGGALLTGAISGLLFCLWIELIYFSRYLPTPVSHGVNSVYGWLLASSTRLFGDESLQLPITAVGLQALAAAIVASRSGPLSAVRGLFAAFVAGFVIAAGDSMFFGFGYEFRPSQLALTALQFMSLGAVVAIPTVIVAAWLKGMTRHVFGNTDNWRKSAHLVASPDATAVFTERKNERRRISWSVVRKGSLAALCVAVAIGITARVREVVVQMHEVKALEASAGRGDSDAQTKLGYMYARGRPVARDDAQAVFWWRKAAEQGNADAQERLAYMYFAGLGIAQDDASALHWIRKAAEQGYAAGEQGLGMMYALGRGIANDDSLAMQWFRKAAEQGNVEAQNSVGNFYALGRGTARDDAAAVEWYRKAAAQGLADAQNNLGVFCALGRGMAQDDVAAVEWFRKAAEHGHADAQNNLGYMYQQGRGLPTDHALALQWFLRAAERGHADAQFNVGQIYEKGEGVAKDDEQAAAWFRKAAEKGHAEAKNRLQAICARGLRAPCAP